MIQPMGERLARVEEKLDQVIEHLESNLRPLEKRVGALERWRTYILGAGTVISVFVAWIMRK